MCKLAAVVNLEKQHRTALSYQQKQQVAKTLRHLFYINSYGQTDGSGVMGLDHDGMYFYHKRAIPSPDFLSTKTVKEFMGNLDDFKFAAFHTRFGTVGGNSDANSHPFEHGNTLLMQNGTVDTFCDTDKLVDGEVNPCTVDSDAVAWAIEQQGVDKTMERYVGAGVFMWFDLAEREFNIVKNDERNLNMLKVKGKEVYIFGTDYHAVALAATRSGLSYDWIKPVKDDTLHTFTLECEYKHRPLTVESWAYGTGFVGSSYPRKTTTPPSNKVAGGGLGKHKGNPYQTPPRVSGQSSAKNKGLLKVV